MGSIRELLHPPGHRGPVIAAGAVALTLGVALEQLRVSPGPGVQLAVAAALAVVLLWLGLQAPVLGSRPEPHQSVLVVCGLLALYVTLLRLADVLGADFGGTVSPDGALFWTGAVQTAAAAAIAARRSSAIAALIAALAAIVAVLAGWSWAFDPGSVTPYRWLLLLLAIGFALTSLVLRGQSLRHAVQLVNAGGVALLALSALQVLDGARALPAVWEVVVVAGGFGLIAAAAADRAPGPAYLGAANLAAFVAFGAAGAGGSMLWWPLLLLAAGGTLLAVGLRPRAPLPPEPDAYRRDDLPLAARAEDVTVRVRRD